MDGSRQEVGSFASPVLPNINSIFMVVSEWRFSGPNSALFFPFGRSGSVPNAGRLGQSENQADTSRASLHG